VAGEKMSKTRATGIHPKVLVDAFGVDAYRYYFLREIQFGQDGNFSWESMVERYNADLANGLGNLASRVLAMLRSYFDGAVPEPVEEGAAGELPKVVDEAVARYDGHMDDVALSPALAAVWDIVGAANRYMVERSPWHLAKDEERRAELESILYASTEVLRILTVLISPIMPGAADRLWAQLGIEDRLDTQRLPEAARWGLLTPGTRTGKGEALFPRVEG
jgi:methionyl-tRNA synthetase